MSKDKRFAIALEDTAKWHKLFKSATRDRVDTPKTFEVTDLLFEVYKDIRDDLLDDKLGAREIPLVDRVIIHNLLSRVLDESYFGKEPNEHNKLFHALFPELPAYLDARANFSKGTTLAQRLESYDALAPFVE